MCLEGVEYTLIGTTIDRPEIVLDGEEMELDGLTEAWMRPLESVFPNRPAGDAPMPVNVPLYRTQGDPRTRCESREAAGFHPGLPRHQL